MCIKVECNDCKKPTWKGCGLHIEQALAGVPVDQRCKCRETNPNYSSNGSCMIQ